MSSAKERILNHLISNVGQTVSLYDLSKIAGTHDWQRTIRHIRQNEGWDIDTVRGAGYRLNSLTPISTGRERETISDKLRYEILQRDNSTCQRCGMQPKDGIVLHIDHKIPVNLGGKSTSDNLWVLCQKCNLGKKDLFNDEDTEKLKLVYQQPSGSQRLKTYIELSPNIKLDTIKLHIISGIRDWPRELRNIRQKYNMCIDYVQPSDDFPNGSYIYYMDRE